MFNMQLVRGMFLGSFFSAIYLIFKGIEIPPESELIILTTGILIGFPFIAWFCKRLPEPVKSFFTKEIFKPKGD